MKEVYKIDVAINLCHIKADSKGNLSVVRSNGNYVDVASNLYSSTVKKTGHSTKSLRR